MLNIAETFELLFDKNNNVAYKALQELQKESIETDCVYPYMDRLSEMLDSDNSYIRTRGLTLIAYNAKWDKDYKIDEIIDNYLKHITDIKPITARQCIKLLPIIAKDKPELKNDILSALHKANICIVSAKYSCGFPDFQFSPIIVAVRYLDYFTTIMEDRLWQVLAKPVFRWRNRSGLSMNAARAA